jgi:hypothetical protein
MSADTPSRGARVLAWLVVALAGTFFVFGIVRYGFSAEVYRRFWHDIAERPDGPMAFRFILQPAMAALAAIHDGIKDARLGRSPYFWTVLSNPRERGGRLRECVVSTARIVLLGLGMDVIYQYEVLKTFYPDEALLVALLLAVVPYLILRGPVDRIACAWMAHANSDPTTQARK